MATIDVKSLLYCHLQPYAKSLGMQILILDYATYSSFNNKLQSKAAQFGISKSSFSELRNAIGDYSCIVLLKSNTYVGDSEIASAFSKVGLSSNDVHTFKPKNANDEIWGSLATSNKTFIYWFPIDVEGFNGNIVNEDIEEFDGMYGSKVRRVNPISFRGIKGFITVNDLIEAIENAWPGQENAVFNFGPNGHIYGQVNQAFDENGLCVLGLAPYKNGSRSRDLSINGVRDAALTFKQLKPILLKMSPDATVYVRMKDPTGFGPNAGRIIQQPADSVDIDDKWGIFIRTDDTHQEIVK